MNSQYLKKHKLPDSPGVYFFLKREEILYIGRATSLRDRVRSYFSYDLLKTRGQLIVDMVEKANSVKFQKTDSVLEAIILEANLIKKYQPFYNTEEKDDKSFNYVAISKEDFPQVIVVRGRDLGSKLQITNYKLLAKFGPFPNSGALTEALKFIRKIFPYRDSKCKLCSVQRQSVLSLREPVGCKPCFNRHLGLCPGTCTGEISKEDYGKTICYIIQIFEGKKKSVLRGLEKEMKKNAVSHEFEKAADCRNKIFALTHIRDVAFIKKEHDTNLQMRTNNANNTNKTRIEAYDVTHLGGKNARGAMVVMNDGEFDKNEYRIFKIRSAAEGDDVGALSEILERRFKHSEWRFPDLAVVDGGTGQLNAALEIIKKFSPATKIVAVVKDDKHKARAILNGTEKTELFKDDVLKLNAEAHRFAIGKLRKAMCHIISSTSR